MTATKKPKAKKSTTKKTKSAKPKNLSALDSAAKVLVENGGSMTTKELIETMAAKKLWISPGGKTPHSTLYAAILREVTTKGTKSRFKKTEPGKFVATKAAEAEEATTTEPDTAAAAEAPKPKAGKAAKGKPGRKKGTNTAKPAETAIPGDTLDSEGEPSAA